MEKQENRYDCPKALWRKFKEVGKIMYNDMMDQLEDQLLICHPKTKRLPQDEWLTIKHNVSVLAALAADEHSESKKK